MTAKPKQLRYKGRWLANWQADIRQEIGDLRKALLDRMSELFLELRTDIDSNTKAIGDVRERINAPY
jgi:chemotaxis regulatin CheY-phosphate phosphatase CheZ